MGRERGSSRLTTRARSSQRQLYRSDVVAGRPPTRISRTARDKDDGIYIQQADGAGLPQVVLKNESLQVRFFPQSWAPDGSGLIVNQDGNGKRDMLFVPLGPDGKPGMPRDLRVTSYNEDGGSLLP